MARDPRDRKGYYAVLNVSPGANTAEVQLAYTFLKNSWRTNHRLNRAKIKEAYDVLTDPVARQRYRDGGKGMGSENLFYIGGGALAAVLFTIAAFVFPGFLLSGPGRFSSGARLLNSVDMSPLGEVVELEENHVFPNGGGGDAYLIRRDDGTEKWFPTGDLEQHFRLAGTSP